MNYQESTLTGTSWVRCNRIVLANPLAGSVSLGPWDSVAPGITFEEEKVMVIDGKTIKMSSGACQKTFDPVAGTFPILDPTTGIPTGTSMSHAELYAILFSLYLQTATGRDNA